MIVLPPPQKCTVSIELQQGITEREIDKQNSGDDDGGSGILTSGTPSASRGTGNRQSHPKPQPHNGPLPCVAERCCGSVPESHRSLGGGNRNKLNAVSKMVHVQWWNTSTHRSVRKHSVHCIIMADQRINACTEVGPTQSVCSQHDTASKGDAQHRCTRHHGSAELERGREQTSHYTLFNAHDH